MASVSYTNLLTFLLTTLFYYLGLKPSPTIDTVNDPTFIKSKYTYLGIYFLIVVIIQFVVNINVIGSMCGGQIGPNIAYSGLVTVVPWTLIFGILIAMIMAYPSFNRLFADVFGYYFIATSANRILTTLLISKDIQAKIDADQSLSQDNKQKMQSAADMIIKICGNTSVIINQMTPTTFMEFWGLLTPLMKSEYAGGTTEKALELRKELFELIVTKDNIGEASWYIYTGILLVSLVQLNIATRGCINNSATQQKNYADFLAKEKEAADTKALAQSTTYTVSS